MNIPYLRRLVAPAMTDQRDWVMQYPEQDLSMTRIASLVYAPISAGMNFSLFPSSLSVYPSPHLSRVLSLSRLTPSHGVVQEALRQMRRGSDRYSERTGIQEE